MCFNYFEIIKELCKTNYFGVVLQQTPNRKNTLHILLVTVNLEYSNAVKFYSLLCKN